MTIDGQTKPLPQEGGLENGGLPPVRFDPRLPRMVSSQTLFQGAREIGIEHAGSLYRLKITRQGKLILNK
jgi:hemin uptake protein HemP